MEAGTTLFGLGETNVGFLNLGILILQRTLVNFMQIEKNRSVHYKHTCEQKPRLRDRSMSFAFTRGAFTSSIEL